MNNTAAPILFVTGTDTGVGKTVISCGMIAELIRLGHSIDVCKPIETGCKKSPAGELIPEDGMKLSEACGRVVDLERIVLYRFEKPVAPVVAAAAEGVTIDFDRIVSDLKLRAAGCELLVIEGAGGILVPITAEKTIADLAAALSAVVLVVVGSKLGAINHSALTCEIIKTRGMRLAGYVLNNCYAGKGNQTAALATNREAIRASLSRYGAEELAYVEHFNEKTRFSARTLSKPLGVFTDLASSVAAQLGLKSKAV